MNVESGEWVVYHPPKSVSFGHQSRIRDPRRAWPVVQRFMTELTRFTLGQRGITLRCTAPELHDGLDIASSRIQEARERFGPEDEQRGLYRFDPHWTLSEGQLSSAIEFALDDDKFPKREAGPTWLSFSYQFCWIEFDGGNVTTRKTESRRILSTLGVIMGQQRLFLQPHFIYSAAWSSESLKDFIDRSELIAPFRFRGQYFKRWFPPQSPTSHGRLLRLEPTWRRGKVVH